MKLDEIYTRLWDCLAAATRESSQPFKVMQAATIGLDGAPNVRTVLLRRASEAESLVTFHTDLRSPKVEELSREPRIALVGADRASNLQIRLFGEARVLRDGQARLDAWQATPDHSLIVYRTWLAPGTPMSEPADAFGEQHAVPGPDVGFEHFCVVEVRLSRIDWLDLSRPDCHERARFLRQGDAWSHSWIAP
jgi:pyridoxamine 5'-phosphate oxidase